MTYKTVFDVIQNGGATAFPGFSGLPLLVVGASLVLAPDLMQRVLPRGLQGAQRKIFGWFFFVAVLFLTTVSFLSAYVDYRTAVADLNTGRYSVIEGAVTAFDPMPYNGHRQERFTVNAHRFSYSDYILTPGFHNTTSHGGPIREGLHVRIAYSGNLILRLEVTQ
jgi:hypothetical protein